MARQWRRPWRLMELQHAQVRPKPSSAHAQVAVTPVHWSKVQLSRLVLGTNAMCPVRTPPHLCWWGAPLAVSVLAKLSAGKSSPTARKTAATERLLPPALMAPPVDSATGPLDVARAIAVAIAFALRPAVALPPVHGHHGDAACDRICAALRVVAPAALEEEHLAAWDGLPLELAGGRSCHMATLMAVPAPQQCAGPSNHRCGVAFGEMHNGSAPSMLRGRLRVR